MSHFPQTQGVSFIQVKNAAGDVIQELPGNPISALLETKDLDFDRRQMMKYLDVIVAEVTDAERINLVNVEIGFRDSLSEEVNWDLPRTLDELAKALFTRNTGRYHKIRILSDSVGVFWRLASLEVFGTSHGRRF